MGIVQEKRENSRKKAMDIKHKNQKSMKRYRKKCLQKGKHGTEPNFVIYNMVFI